MISGMDQNGWRVRICCVLCLSLLSACSSVAPVTESGRRATIASTTTPASITTPEPAENAPRVDLRNQDRVVSLLQAQHSEWAGTRHRWGGTNRHGVDCSGFVYVTLREKFGHSPPRTTEAQSRWGEPVDAKKLRAGDLVFFRTGIKSRHVGIYMGKRQFLHASASKGVKVSSMDDYYWRNRFWQARRAPANAVAER